MALPSTYNTGTATVASAGVTVTGQGTAWINAVKPGDRFGTHKGLGIRILTVDSNTQLTLAYPAPAALAQTAAAYEIAITPVSSEIQASVRALLEQLQNGNLEALTSLAGSADRLPYFNGAGSMTLAVLTSFGRSLINDADAVEGRATLDVAQRQSDFADSVSGRGLIVGAFGLGGTQAPQASDANLVIRTGFYLITSGTNVPVSAGLLMVLTRLSASSIHQIYFEYQTDRSWTRNFNGSTWSTWKPFAPQFGTNANGIFIRFTDGTQICWRGYSSQGVVSWPAAFAAEPSVVATANGGSGNPRWCSVISVDATTVRVDSFTATGGASAINGSVVGVGRWY